MKKIALFFVFVSLIVLTSCINPVDPNKPFDEYSIHNKSDFTITVGSTTIEPKGLKSSKQLDSSFADGYITQKVTYEGKEYTIKPMKYFTTSGLKGNITGAYTCFVTVENAPNFEASAKYNYSIKNNTDFDITVKIYPYGSSTPVEKQVQKKDASGNTTTVSIEEVKYYKPKIKIFASNKEIKTQATEVNNNFLTITETPLANKQNAVLISVNSL